MTTTPNTITDILAAQGLPTHRITAQHEKRRSRHSRRKTTGFYTVTLPAPSDAAAAARALEAAGHTLGTRPTSTQDGCWFTVTRQSEHTHTAVVRLVSNQTRPFARYQVEAADATPTRLLENPTGLPRTPVAEVTFNPNDAHNRDEAIRNALIQGGWLPDFHHTEVVKDGETYLVRVSPLS